MATGQNFPFYGNRGRVWGIAAEVVMIEELHCWMGHILLEAVRCLVTEGAIEGIKLDKCSQLMSCYFCEYAKAPCKPIRKIHKMPCASTFGE